MRWNTDAGWKQGEERSARTRRCCRLITKPLGRLSSSTVEMLAMSFSRYCDTMRPLPASSCMSRPPPTARYASRNFSFRVYLRTAI